MNDQGMHLRAALPRRSGKTKDMGGSHSLRQTRDISIQPLGARYNMEQDTQDT